MMDQKMQFSMSNISAIFFVQLRGNLEEWLFSSHSTHRAGKEKKIKIWVHLTLKVDQ